MTADDLRKHTEQGGTKQKICVSRRWKEAFFSLCEVSALEIGEEVKQPAAVCLQTRRSETVGCLEWLRRGKKAGAANGDKLFPLHLHLFQRAVPGGSCTSVDNRQRDGQKGSVSFAQSINGNF